MLRPWWKFQMSNVITSGNNAIVKKVKSLKLLKNRNKDKLFLVEGFKMAQEATKSQAEIENIILDENANLDLDEKLQKKVVRVKGSLFSQLSDLKNPEGVILICKEIEKEIDFDENLLILDEIRDPGNMGTIIRTAEAFNYKNILLLGNCVDIYNSKVLRATMGSIFRVSINQIDIKTIKDLRHTHTILATALDEDSIDITSMTKIPKHAIIIGNESHGVRKEVSDLAHKKVIIPISENIDSLNAAIASSISMFYFNLIYSKKEKEV